MTEEELDKLAELIADKISKKMYPHLNTTLPAYIPVHQPYSPYNQPNPLYPNPTVYPQPAWPNPFSPTTVTCDTTTKS